MDQLGSRKRKGLGGKMAVMSLYRASITSKPSLPSSTHHTVTSAATARAMKPSSARGHNNNMTTGISSAKQRATATAAAAAAAGAVEFILKQEQVPNPSVSVVLPDSSREYSSRGYATNVLDYSGLPADEAVDMKAATYITNVRERIRLHVQTINS